MSKRAIRCRPAKPRPTPKAHFSLQSRNETVKELPAPIKSDSDKKFYKVIKLRNGLTALLISDPSKPPRTPSDSSSEEELSSSAESSEGSESDGSDFSAGSDTRSTKKHDYDEEKQAACALCVGVGSFSDPSDIQGLAHFVEHMVFMGSEKYPRENDFDSFIKKKGGSDNAATDCEVTTFYLEVPEKYLLQSLDKFSQFFVSPLMHKEAMQREREAIESEFAMALPSDSNRKDQLLSSLFPPGHPARTFTWGNLRSLKDKVNDDEKLHRAAHRFRERHYSGHRMTVAVQARMDLKTLEQYTVDTFGQIPSNNLPPDDFSPYNYSAHLVTPEFRSMYHVKPISDTTEVHLTWCIRSLVSEYESKPHQYVSYLLGHEGAGGLLSYLKKKVWALGIYTGNAESGIDYTSMYSLFSAQVVLTQDGLAHVDEVLEAIFSYLNLLRKLGPNERIFNEIKCIEENNFRFVEESQPADYVETLAENMHFYPSQHYITGDKLYYKYDPQGITDLLELMTAESVNILVLSNKRSPPVVYDQKEEWFGTEYKKQDIPAEWMRRWSEVTPYEEFHLPEENIYITTDFSLIPPAKEYLEVADKLKVDLWTASSKDLYEKTPDEELTVVLKEGKYEARVSNFRLDRPSLLRKNGAMEVWYKPDFKFRLPTALLYFYFITPLSLKSARDSCLLDLWTDVLQQGLKEAVYPADMADLSHSLYTSDKGLTLKINGYSQKLHLLVDVITQEMRVVGENLTESLFEAVRDVRARAYHNTLIKPAKLAKDVRMQLLLSPYVSLRDKAELIGAVTCQELRDFSRRFVAQLYMQVLVQGNLPWHEALRIAENVQRNIKYEPLPVNQMPEIQVYELPLGERRCRVSSFNLENTNSIVTNYYQSGPQTQRDTAVLEVLMMLMEEPMFDRLRTKEQLGYSVFNLMRYTFGVLGYSLTVNAQADKYTAGYVDARMESFLKKFARDLRRLPERSLAAAKQSLVQLKHTADVELREEVERNWREIVSREYFYSRLYAEAAAIEKLKLSDVKSWFERHTLNGTRENLRKLSVQVVGHKSPDAANATEPTAPVLGRYRLRYVGAEPGGDGEAETPEGFIRDLERFRGALKLFPAQEVTLPDC